MALALVGIWIAWWQSRTSAMDLQHKHDDARFRVYRAAVALLASIQAEGGVTGTTLRAFLEGTFDATFYFEADLVDYLSDLRTNAVRAMRVAGRLHDGSLDHIAREKTADEEAEVLGWFMSQFDALRERFRPYLQIDYAVHGAKPR